MNVLELRQDLLLMYQSLRDGKIGTDEVKNAANLCGKIISTAKCQIEYNKMTHSQNRIAFLDVNEPL